MCVYIDCYRWITPQIVGYFIEPAQVTHLPSRRAQRRHELGSLIHLVQASNTAAIAYYVGRRQRRSGPPMCKHTVQMSARFSTSVQHRRDCLLITSATDGGGKARTCVSRPWRYRDHLVQVSKC
jgi:hypothetical protein